MLRKTFIKKCAIGAAGAFATAGGYAWQIEPFWVEFVKINMPVKNLPDSLVGKTIMQISDLHIGDEVDTSFIINALRQAQVYQPHFVVYTGDFVNGTDPVIRYNQLQQVLQHTVLGSIGTLGILGNHDYGMNWTLQKVAEKVTQMATHAGINLLRNQNAQIQGINFIGIDDYWGPNFNPAQAMSHYNPAIANLVLCHNPDVCDLDVWNGYSGWILSGHTHGGQCKPPFLPPPILPINNKKYAAGQIDVGNNRTLYVNRALGHRWQLRFNVRPEITVFTLQKI